MGKVSSILYGKFYKFKLTIAGYQIFLGSYPLLTLLFMALVEKIETWGFHTSNTSALTSQMLMLIGFKHYPYYIYSHNPHIERSVFQRENPSHNL